MNSNQELLLQVARAVQAGQADIHWAMGKAVRTELKDTLRSQFAQLESIRRDIWEIASARGWDIGSDRAKRRMDFGFYCQDRDSKIAEKLIRSNTQGMIRSLKALHRYPGNDQRLCILSQRLLDCQRANIIKLQGFV